MTAKPSRGKKVKCKGCGRVVEIKSRLYPGYCLSCATKMLKKAR